MNSITKYYNTRRICPAILQLVISGAISILQYEGMYAEGMTFYVNPRGESVVYDFVTHRTFDTTDKAKARLS